MLKGQSKQAGAKRTTDFGACRDLQGRRLRHVNDEIKLRKWREMQRRKSMGLPAGEEAMWKTPSGLYNWHLMVPNWASDSLSKKGTRQMQRQMQRELQKFQTEEEKAALKKNQQEQEYQQSVTAYVRQTAEAAETIAVQDAIQQGFAAAAKKRKATLETTTPPEEKKNELVTLSGDFVVNETTGGWQLQSKSEFGTMALVLDKAPDSDSTIYFEVQVVSAGLAQVGWADLTDFAPDTDSGDGVGDVGSSYAFDGSRCKKFNGGLEYDHGQLWNEGDVIGCKYDVSTGAISFSINGKEMGDAFTTDKARPLVPALSCNGGEILELHIHPEQMKFRPADCVPVFDLLTADVPTTDKDESQDSSAADNEATAQSAAVANEGASDEPPPKQPKKKKAKPTPAAAEPLNLDDYTSEAQLEELGMDRLKGALMAIGVKCGGSLQERSARLWSLKGLKREEYPMKVRAKNFKL